MIGLVSAAVIALLYLASVIGWGMDGRAPASGWIAIALAAVVGALAGGSAVAAQRSLGAPRVVAPLVAPVLVALLALVSALATAPFGSGSSLGLTFAVMLPFGVLAVTLGTTLVVAAGETRWRAIGGVAGVVVAIALVVGLVAG